MAWTSYHALTNHIVSILLRSSFWWPHKRNMVISVQFACLCWWSIETEAWFITQLLVHALVNHNVSILLSHDGHIREICVVNYVCSMSMYSLEVIYHPVQMLVRALMNHYVSILYLLCNLIGAHHFRGERCPTNYDCVIYMILSYFSKGNLFFAPLESNLYKLTTK